MIRGFLLAVNPAGTWARIKQKPRGVLYILFIHLLPLLLITSAVQGYGLVHWGKRQGQVLWLKKFPVGETVVFEISQVIIWLVLIFVGAVVVKNLTQTFHARHSFHESFSLVAWSLSPLLLLRMADGITFVSPWLTYGVGMALVLSVLYYGIPAIMEPDPPQAFGLYLGAAIVVLLLTALTRLMFAFYVRGRFPALEKLFSDIAALLPI